MNLSADDFKDCPDWEFPREMMPWYVFMAVGVAEGVPIDLAVTSPFIAKDNYTYKTTIAKPCVEIKVGGFGVYTEPLKPVSQAVDIVRGWMVAGPMGVLVRLAMLDD